jgi:para-nitrobenzyl esterase
MATWVHFARYGDPNNATIPAWRPYAPDDRATLLVDSECTVDLDPDGVERRAWGGRRPR